MGLSQFLDYGSMARDSVRNLKTMVVGDSGTLAGKVREAVVYPVKDAVTHSIGAAIDAVRDVAEERRWNERAYDLAESGFKNGLEYLTQRMKNDTGTLMNRAIRYQVVGYQLGVIYGNAFIWYIHQEKLHEGVKNFELIGKKKVGEEYEMAKEHWLHHGQALRFGMFDKTHAARNGTKVNARKGSKFFLRTALKHAPTLLFNVGFAVGVTQTLLEYGYKHNRSHVSLSYAMQKTPIHLNHHMCSGYIEWPDIHGEMQNVRKQDLNRGVFNEAWDNIMHTAYDFWGEMSDAEKQKHMKNFIAAMNDPTISEAGPAKFADMLKRDFEPARVDRVWQTIETQGQALVAAAVESKPLLKKAYDAWLDAHDTPDVAQIERDVNMYYDLIREMEPELAAEILPAA